MGTIHARPLSNDHLQRIIAALRKGPLTTLGLVQATGLCAVSTTVNEINYWFRPVKVIQCERLDNQSGGGSHIYRYYLVRPELLEEGK